MEFNSFGSTNDRIVMEAGSDGISHSLVMETGSQSSLRTRPFEGDLVYFPFNKKVFQITFVEHELPFYPERIIPVPDGLDLLEYGNEIFNTGIPEIDEIEDEHDKEESNVTYQPKRDMVLSLGERLSTKQVILVLTIIQHLLLLLILSHDENSGKLVVVPRNGGFPNDIIVGGTETTAGYEVGRYDGYIRNRRHEAINY